MEYLTKELRREIIGALKRGKSGKVLLPFTKQRPTRWEPHLVPRKKTGTGYFTDAGAWDFILDQLEAEVPVEVIILKLPHGKKGYVIKSQEEKVYIKFEFVSGKVLSRSFHWLD